MCSTELAIASAARTRLALCSMLAEREPRLGNRRRLLPLCKSSSRLLWQHVDSEGNETALVRGEYLKGRESSPLLQVELRLDLRRG